MRPLLAGVCGRKEESAALETRVNEFSTKRHACYRAGSADEARLWARPAAVSGPGRLPRSRSKRPTMRHRRHDPIRRSESLVTRPDTMISL